MAKGYNPTEYIYSSARIRALEIKVPTKDRLYHLADADATQILSQLDDMGFETAKSGETLSREDMLESLLVKGYGEIETMECAGVTDFMRYQYDANNIKAIIKCAARGVAADSMLSVLGTVDIAKARKAFEEKDYSCFPENIAQAVAQAEEAFASTKDPQKIDFIIDRACFSDMVAAAKRIDVPLAKELVRTKIDQTNIMITLRIIQMGLGKVAEGILREAYIGGGSFDAELFVSALDEGVEALAGEISRAGYEKLGEAIANRETLGALEKRVDDLWVLRAKEAKSVSFGAEIAIGYIAALEYAVKNVRIILASKDAGLAPELIRERLRDCYA